MVLLVLLVLYCTINSATQHWHFLLALHLTSQAGLVATDGLAGVEGGEDGEERRISQIDWIY